MDEEADNVLRRKILEVLLESKDLDVILDEHNMEGAEKDQLFLIITEL